jgi:AraC family L-rhamnose operon regulatory protein RhaS
VLFAASAHAQGFHMAERADPFHKLVYVLEGEVALHGSTRPAVPVSAGSVVIIPRGTRHRLADVHPSTLLLLCLGEVMFEADEDLAKLWDQLMRVPQRRLQLTRPVRQRIEHLWRRAMLEAAHARTGGTVMARTLAAQLLVQLARLPSSSAGDDAKQRIASVAKEIDETFFDDWSLDRAAARAGMSRRRFSELFREASGRTMWDYLNDRRLTHAAQLLKAGERSITGVMFSCGFNDLSHFYRLFRARHGAPPRQWAERSGRDAR